PPPLERFAGLGARWVELARGAAPPLTSELIHAIALRRILEWVEEHVFAKLIEETDALRVLSCLCLAKSLFRPLLSSDGARRTAPPVYPLLHCRSGPGPFFSSVPRKPLHLRRVQCLGDTARGAERLDGGCRVLIHHALASGFAEGLKLVCEFTNQAPHFWVLDGVDQFR